MSTTVSFQTFDNVVSLSSTPVSLFDDPNKNGQYQIVMSTVDGVLIVLNIAIYTINAARIGFIVSSISSSSSRLRDIPATLGLLSPHDDASMEIDFVSDRLTFTTDQDISDVRIQTFLISTE